MRKKELLRKIEELENRILILEAKEAVRDIPYCPEPIRRYDGPWWGIYPPYGTAEPYITFTDGTADPFPEFGQIICS